MHFVYIKMIFVSKSTWIVLKSIWRFRCHNPSLGLAMKARAYKVVGQEGNPGVTSHTPRSAKECEGMNPHTPK